MADLNHLTKLFQAIAARDWNAAYAIAREVASAEERIGHHAAAQRLRGALQPNGNASAPNSAQGADITKSSTGTYFLSSALTQVPADRQITDVRLSTSTRRQLQEIISEWAHRQELSMRNIERRTKLLFHGPPGCGKSITGRAMGREMGLPVYVVRFDAIVGSYLGQTALHLRQIFRFAETTPCVILLDEIDALGKRRGSPLDVGELDRVVIALLQELEHSHPAGLLIATSNLAGHLDDALWRRFDLVIEFPTPSRKDLDAFAVQCAKTKGVVLTSRMRAEMGRAKSYADIERLIDAQKRRLILTSR